MADHIWWKVIVCGSNINNTSHSYSSLLWKEIVKNVIFKARFLKHAWFLHQWLPKNISAVKIITQAEPKIDSEENASWFYQKNKNCKMFHLEMAIYFPTKLEELFRSLDFIKIGRKKNAENHILLLYSVKTFQSDPFLCRHPIQIQF